MGRSRAASGGEGTAPAPSPGAGPGTDAPSPATDWQAAYWKLPAVVAEHAASPRLTRGERSALAACFPDGLAGRPALDVGCGAGRVTVFLHRAGAETVGIDPSEEMIAAARRAFPQLDLRVGDARRLEFDDGAFELVVCAGNPLDYLHPKRDRLRALEEVARVTRSGGRLVLSHHSLPALCFGWYNSMRPRKLRFRGRQVVAGRVLRPECYIPCVDGEGPPLLTYFAWPGRAIRDLRDVGFDLLSVHPNSPTLRALQGVLGTTVLTRLADPWPYYLLRRR